MGSFSCLAQTATSRVGATNAAPVAGSAQPNAAAPAPSPRFDIYEYVVDGNTVLSVPDVEEAVYPFLGDGRNAADVDKARDALQRAYEDRGYQAVQIEIPQQGIESGTIHLQVVENPVGRLRVVDSHYHSLDMIKETAPSVAEGQVPNFRALEKDIVALNAQPDLKVTPRIQAGTAPGTVDVDLQVEDSLPIHGSVEINNAHNQATTPLRTSATFTYDNLWQRGHSVTLSYQIAPENPSDSRVLSGSYTAPLPGTPLSFMLYGVKSDSDVAAVAATNVIGKGSIVGTRAIINLPGSASFFQSITTGVDRKDLTQNVITSNVPSDSPVLYYPVTLAYAATLQEGDTTTQADASINAAIPGLGSPPDKFDAQRFNAEHNYIYFKADLSRVQPLPRDLIAYAKVEGQITGDPLLSSEQFSIGGQSSVRGYLEAERLGDYGVRGTVELRSPSFAALISPRIDNWRVLVFADGAGVALREPLADQQATYMLGSVGVGSQMTAFTSFNADVDLALPLVDGAVTQAGRPHFDFRVWSEF
jgi:hemolysin activation/secretion protein